jgi:tRNA pseudouridine55 synthase
VPKQNANLTGLLIVDKPGLPFGWQDAEVDIAAYDLPTSHDVVQRIRRLSGQRRIGHTGTLDPMASGVLVLCLGQTTRLVEYYQGHNKTYLAEITLGAATDTYDALGAATRTAPTPALTPQMIEHALDRFRGEIDQKPPVFSALKQGGESLHRKARRGETVEIEARQITIHDLSLVDWKEPDRLRIRVSASAGTYVRSLAHDLGEALGTVAHLSALRREAAGAITLDDALTWAELSADGEHLADHLRPPGWKLSMPARMLDGETIRLLGFGQRIGLAQEGEAAAIGDLAQGFNEAGAFVGILRCLGAEDDGTALWKAEKWFALT